MIDSLQFEGVLARFTLRHWSRVAEQRSDCAWVRGVDEHELLSLLMRTLDVHGLRRLRAFLFALDGHVALVDERTELLRHVARRIASGELILAREAITPRASEVVDVLASERTFRRVVNEIDEGEGLLERARVERQASAEQAMQLAQQGQARTLREAAVHGSPFCEVCAAVESRLVGEREPEPEPLHTQAKQAQTLTEASRSGTAFCEVCAACLDPSAPPQTKTPPPPTPMSTQARQAQTLTAASDNGTAFCEQCRC